MEEEHHLPVLGYGDSLLTKVGYGEQPLLSRAVVVVAGSSSSSSSIPVSPCAVPANCPPPRRFLLLIFLLHLALSILFLHRFYFSSASSWLRHTNIKPSPSPLSTPSVARLSLPPTTISSSLPAPHCSQGRIFVYDLPPRFNADLLASCSSLVPWVDLCPALDNNGLGTRLDLPSWLGTGFWYFTSQFGGEVLYHAKMLLHPCRTLDPEQATLFFVPFYAGLDLSRFLFVPSTARERDRLGHELLAWLKLQKHWKRHSGLDHFMMIGRITWDFRRTDHSRSFWDIIRGRYAWGSDFFYRPELKYPWKLTIEKSLFDSQEIAVPYPTSFHPRSDADLATWQRIVRSANRSLLFSYAGGPRPQFKNDFRCILLDQCKQSAMCRSVDCSEQRCEHPLPVMELFVDSIFCLQPRGDSFTRRSIFDSLIAGCIPVFFWHRTAYLQYDLHLPKDGDSYSVFINRKDVREGKRIEEILKGYSDRRIRKMRATLIKAIPEFIYTVPAGYTNGSIRDAFDIAVDGVFNFAKSRLRSG